MQKKPVDQRVHLALFEMQGKSSPLWSWKIRIDSFQKLQRWIFETRKHEFLSIGFHHKIYTDEQKWISLTSFEKHKIQWKPKRFSSLHQNVRAETDFTHSW